MSRVLYVLHCYGKRYKLCVIILSKQIPQLIIISRLNEQQNLIYFWINVK